MSIIIVYLSLGPSSTASATLAFTFGTTSTTRTFEIKVVISNCLHLELRVQESNFNHIFKPWFRWHKLNVGVGQGK